MVYRNLNGSWLAAYSGKSSTGVGRVHRSDMVRAPQRALSLMRQCTDGRQVVLDGPQNP